MLPKEILLCNLYNTYFANNQLSKIVLLLMAELINPPFSLDADKSLRAFPQSVEIAKSKSCDWHSSLTNCINHTNFVIKHCKVGIDVEKSNSRIYDHYLSDSIKTTLNCATCTLAGEYLGRFLYHI